MNHTHNFHRSIIQECKDENSAAYTLEKVLQIFKDFFTNSNRYGCLLPCKITTFEINLKLYHENTWYIYNKLTGSEDTEKIISEEHSFGLFYFYETLRIEEKIETLIFDLGGVLAAAGGNLGLCLGFSCLSILHAILSFISHLMKKLTLARK